MQNKQELVNIVTSQLQRKDLSQQAVIVIQKSTERVLERIKQNFDAQLVEDSSPIIDKLISSAATNMLAMTQKWSDKIENDLTVFPEGTRYIYNDGYVTTIIIEQHPQSRHINIGKKVHLLSLPYVQFVMYFQNNCLFNMLKIACTKKPITDIDQVANFIPLPNVDSTHSVCMGNFRWPNNKNMTKDTNAVIGNFWQSEFTWDSSYAFQNFSINNKLSVREPISFDASLEVWQRKTLENNLYATESATKYKPGGPFRQFLWCEKNVGSHAVGQSIVNNLKQEITKAVSCIGVEVKSLLKSIDLSGENQEKSHVKTLEHVIKEIVVAAYSELWEYSDKQLKDEIDRLRKNNQDSLEQLKKLW